MRKSPVFLFLVLLSAAVNSLTINEIMYNPSTEQGDDAYLEWIELYNEGDSEIDLTNWKIDNYNFDDYNLSPQEYVIVARNKDRFTLYYNHSNCTVLDGYFSLSNTADSINLSDGTAEIIVDYNSSTGADGNGHTLENYEGFYESLCINGTPGARNSIYGFSTDYSVIKINEFMPDPIGDDDFDMPNGEWVELYNSGNMDLNLRSLVLYDAEDSDELYITDTDTLNGTVIRSGSYLVVYRNRDSDFSLNNNGYDELRLYDGYPVSGSNLIDSVSYSTSVENKSWAKIDGIWKKTVATPGKENIDRSFEYNYSVLRINELLPDPLGYDSAAMPAGEWVELYNPSSTEIDTNLMFFMDSNNQKLYISPTTTHTTLIQPESFLTVYINGQSGFLNNEGIEKIRLFNKDGNLVDEIEYAGSKEGVSWSRVDNIWQQTMPTPGKQNVDNQTNLDSYLKIEDIYDLGSDEKAKFGQTIRVKVNIFKGSTAKSSISLWAEDEHSERISKESKTNIYTYFTNYTLTLPLQLLPNCDHDYPDGNYTLIIEGLDRIDTYPFSVYGITKDMCDYVEIDKSEKSSSGVQYTIDYFHDIIYLGEEFETNISIENNDDSAHKFEIWSYVYKGSKSYSGEREANKLTAYVGKKSSKIISLNNIVKEADEGVYKFKIKILKDELKTPYELTKDTIIEKDLKNTSQSAEETSAELMKGSDSQKSIKTEIQNKTALLSNPRIIYQSTAVKAKNLAPYLFVLMMLSLIFYSFLRKL